VAVQIAGCDPQVMADAARRHVDDGVQVIDINFGCPAKKVCRRAAGSALLSDPALIGRIVRAVELAVDVPVTVKTRTGLTPGDDRGVDAAVVAVDNGAAMVVMHGRSRECRFKGRVDFAAVRQLKSRVQVPVMVNGDIHSVATAKAALTESGADGIMIGRAALGQPWIFAALTGARMPNEMEKWQLICEHVAMMHDFYGEVQGVGIVRKHVIAYLGHMRCSELTPKFVAIGAAAEQRQWLADMALADRAA
jgi:tRNA-dihydrouridine synthase B